MQSEPPEYDATGLDEYHLAAYCMMDALQGRDKHGRLHMTARSRFVQLLFFYQTSDWELRAFYVFVLLHSLSAFFERASPSIAIGLTVPSLVFFIIDITAKSIFMTPRDCLSKRWNFGQVRCIALCCFALHCVASPHCTASSRWHRLVVASLNCTFC